MAKDFKNIEDLFKSSFEGYKLEPSDKVWNNINLRLKLSKYFSTKIIGTTVIIASVALVAVFLYNTKVDKSLKLENHFSSDSNNIELVEQANIISNVQAKENIIYENKQKIQITESSENEPIPKNRNSRNEDLTPVITSKSVKVLAETNLGSENKINNKATPPPLPKFTVQSTEGCTPFELKLENLTKEALTFEWNFGDGNISTEVSPSYTYRYPGIYKVELKAVGFGGTAIYIDSIVVHDPPKAQLNWPYKSDIQTGQKIMIPNESENISEIEWNYGDNTFSDEIDGKHVFNKEGEYSIVLKVWSANDCMDSVVIENIKVVNANGRIAFPNAFTPNLEGASSGYYRGNDYFNDVFYPKTNKKVSSYEIRIFSKAGIEVFKSTDILYGWNGYYNNRLMPQGVYVYIASGKFEGGQIFNHKGNLTIFHKK